MIEAAYRRLARKYHPDVSPDPESQERMVRINQAWELLRDPVEAGGRRPGPDTECRIGRAGRGRGRQGAGHGRAPGDAARHDLRPGQPVPAGRRSAAGSGARRSSPGRRFLVRRRRGAAAPAATGRVNRVDVRSLQRGRRLRPDDDGDDAGGRQRRPAAGQPVRERAQLRTLPRLVPRRDRPLRPRVHRVARSDADRADLPGRARRPAADPRTAGQRTAAQTTSPGACSAAAERHRPGSRARRTR